MSEDVSKLLRELPSVSELLESEPIGELCREFGAGATKLEIRRLIEEARAAIRSGRSESPLEAETLASQLRGRLVRLCRPEGRSAINAAGWPLVVVRITSSRSRANASPQLSSQGCLKGQR